MAADVTTHTEVRPGLGKTEEQAPPRPYWRRFLVVYVLLGLAVVGGIVAAILVPSGSHERRSLLPAEWSSWQPPANTTSKSGAIALHVAAEYSGPSGNQLAYAVAHEPLWQQEPIRAVIIRGDIGSRTAVALTNDTDSVMYTLCGSGDECTLEANPTFDLVAQLRREALELALYTFKYIPQAQSTFVLLPRIAGQPILAFWQRQDLARELTRPLNDTLSPIVPPIGGMQPTETETLQRLVNTHLYGFRAQETLDGSYFLVLSRIR